jgi:hypothetical protein
LQGIAEKLMKPWGVLKKGENSLNSGVAPARSVDDEPSKAAGGNTGNWEGNNPTHVDPGNHAPVNGAPGTGAKTDTDGGTGDALGGGDGEF